MTRRIKTAITLGSLGMYAPFALAQNLPPQTPANVDALLAILCRIFGWAFTLLIILAVVFGLVAAFRYLTAAGDPEKVKKANYTLLYAAIAVAVAIVARGVPYIVGSIMGVSITQLGGAGGCF